MSEAQMYQVGSDDIGMCGCGEPGEVMALVAVLLGCLKSRVDPRDLLPYNAIFYQFDRARLIEHGSSLPGWLTPKGEAFLGALLQFGTGIFDNCDKTLDRSTGEFF